MSRPSLQEGFKYWQEEVVFLPSPEKDEPYIPALALVGIYAALQTTGRLKSYDWRRTVLRSPEAMEGYRHSLTSFFQGELDDTYEIPISDLEPLTSAGQHVSIYRSIKDGLPHGTTTIPANEEFLAKSLGRACHDHVVALRPLRLFDQGLYTMKNYYPETAALVERFTT